MQYILELNDRCKKKFNKWPSGKEEEQEEEESMKISMRREEIFNYDLIGLEPFFMCVYCAHMREEASASW